jgi:hypothetical protein
LDGIFEGAFLGFIEGILDGFVLGLVEGNFLGGFDGSLLGFVESFSSSHAAESNLKYIIVLQAPDW